MGHCLGYGTMHELHEVELALLGMACYASCVGFQPFLLDRAIDNM